MPKKKLTKKQEKKISDGIKSLKELQEQIAPFTEPMRTIEISTTGHWDIPDNKKHTFTREDFERALRKIARPLKKVAEEKR